jgi:hypothetical protein
MKNQGGSGTYLNRLFFDLRFEQISLSAADDECIFVFRAGKNHDSL